MGNILDFYKGKRIFLTGHTGFKGSWMCRILANAGAVVHLKPQQSLRCFKLLILKMTYIP